MHGSSPIGSRSRSRSCTTGPGDTLDGFGVTGFPETFVLDREGRVVEAFAGAVDGDDVRPRLLAAIDRALET